MEMGVTLNYYFHMLERVYVTMMAQEFKDEEDEELSNSQYSLDLSQNTVKTLMEAESNKFEISENFVIYEEPDMNIEVPPMGAPSSITIQRSIFKQNLMEPQSSQQVYIPTTYVAATSSHLYAPPPLHHCEGGISQTHTTLTQSTPPVSSGSPRLSDCSNSSMMHHHLSPLSSQPFMPSLRPTIPSNMPFCGDYGFKLEVKDDEKPSKTATFTYSNLTKRAYIRRDAIVGLTFSFIHIPPRAIIRCMAIHKTPELIGEVLQCCPKHIDEQTKKGHQHPRHFICGAPKTDAVYCEDPLSGRLSITIPADSLQRKSETTLQALFVFPCFTSELHKGPGQLAQLIFTLEIEGHVVGRAVLDARVCASTGRDRENDEAKLTTSPVQQSVESSESVTAARQSRKRPSVSQNLECNIPTKIGCQRLTGDKQTYVANTYPELFPFVDVCIKMMERVYEVQVQVDDGENPLTALSTAASVVTSTMASSRLVRSEQMESDEALLTQPVKEEEDEDEDGPSQSYSQSTNPFIPNLLSQGSYASTSSAGSTSLGTMDVLRIQVKRNFSNSSSGSDS